ncbi:MAG: RsmB/NOP family class I SAM-dependent RNA methyltransferase [Desulfovibrio sp.]|jgi:16S rRNA (cytosine1407-C5)-methyltransferase|nr:RsmB/NOP family class I SAM-dependent RNA methyltransferase [Desulfovibrio sp.]
MRTLPPRSFRLACKPEHTHLVEMLLRAQGFIFTPDPFFPPARRLVSGPFSLGSSLAAVFGYIYIQDRSSMLPPLALNPEPGASVLDMCASPGGKTGILAQLTGQNAFVLANEPSGDRLITLRRNLQTLNLFSCATTSYPGEKLPLPSAPDARTTTRLPHAPGTDDDEMSGGWDCILLDPPCSGWGTAEKHPRVLRLWQGDKVKPLIGLQRRLLAEAARLLRPGGKLVYSTCTTNVEENEAQLRFAREELGLVFLPLEPLPGFIFADPRLPEFVGVWRVNSGQDGQGFFVSLLQKPETCRTGDGARPDEQHGYGRRARGDSRKHRAMPLDRSLLAEGYVDTALLPPGDIAVFNSVIRFLPAGSRALPAHDFSWKGFPLGRFERKLRISPHLRGLMPAINLARRRGLPCLDLEDPAPAMALLTGQSLIVNASSPEMGLYFRGLPLCRLTVKGARAVLPPL